MSSKALATDVQPDWEGRRRIAADRLEELRHARGVATLEGKTFDSRAIVEAEAELDAIAAAQVEQERRRRQDLDAEIERKKADIRSQLVACLDARSKAINEAEAATYRLASALQHLFAHSNEAFALMKALDVTSLSISENASRLRASYRIANILGPVCGARLGGIQIPAAAGPHLADGTYVRDSWHDADALKIADDISKALPKQEQDQ